MIPFRKQDAAAKIGQGAPAPEFPVAVIGDVHGRADQLLKLAKIIPRGFAWIFVGDLIDRGEQSAIVLRFVADVVRGERNFACVLGNHERMMLDALDDPTGAGPLWLRFGGRQTLASFGLHRLSLSPQPEEIEREMTSLRGRLGNDLISWLDALPLVWSSGSLAVVHAAADPVVPLDAQVEKTLLWVNASSFKPQDVTACGSLMAIRLWTSRSISAPGSLWIPARFTPVV